MSDIVNINLINPNTFELQDYSVDDTSLITNFEVQTSFNPKSDKIEYFIYDLNRNILYSNVNGYGGYQLIDNNLVLDPENDLRNQGFEEGNYNTLYNFVSPKLASSPNFPYFISQISTDRTEIRLDTTSIPNDLVISSSLELTADIQNSTGSYYDFYLDFGNNELIIANNALLDTSSINNPTVLIKLYEPLPEQFVLNTQTWVVTQVANSVAYNIDITRVFNLVDETIQLKGPNLNLSIKDQINNSTDYSNLSQLDSTNQSQGSGSLQYQLNSMLAQTGIEINVDYSNYANFVHFSSAQTRLENFYYKLSLIQTYQASSSIATAAPTNYYVSSSNIIWQSKINEIITGFDDYEYYLYYSSGSTAWPKSNTTPPYTNYLTTSNSGSNWFVSQSIVAEEYDIENNNALINAIPGYLLDDPENAQYEIFVEMVGQYFDTIFLYTQDITNKYNADNRINYGVSKDLVADILRDMGIKIYQNNFSTNDLYSALLGFTPSGSLYNLPYTTGSLPTPTGYEYINTYVTASATGSLIPTEDINAEIYKRIYANLPYLLKKKGTTEGLKALVTLYGIPDTILQVNEFGGQNKIIEDDYDLWFDQYNYAFDTQGTNYVTSSFELDPTWNAPGNVPSAVEFRFKTNGLPTNTGYYSQSLWSNNLGTELRLRYTGSGYTSGSYSGSIPNPYNEFALLEFIPDFSSDPTTSASVYLPFFDGGWWSVLINKSGDQFTLCAGNKNYLGNDSNYVNYFSSSVVTGIEFAWGNSTAIYLGSGSSGKIFSGSLQEYRFYTETLNTSSFEDYIMYPYSIDANGINTAPDTLAFRATLGGELYTASVSIHPKITGSWITTQSFSDDTSTFVFTQDFTSFVDNVETVYPNQFPSGIKNRVSNKIRQQNEVLPYSGSEETNLPQNTALSPFISVQQDVPASGSYTPNIDYVEVAFSPQNEINNDIAGQLGYFNIGEYIGDPRLVSSSAETYPALDALRDYYFEKYTGNYNIWDYIRLIKYFDNSLFKMIQDFIPARTNLASGLVIKQTTLERNKYPVPQVSPSSSIAWIGSGSFSINNLLSTSSYDMEGSSLFLNISEDAIVNINGFFDNTSPTENGGNSQILYYPPSGPPVTIYEGLGLPTNSTNSFDLSGFSVSAGSQLSWLYTNTSNLDVLLTANVASIIFTPTNIPYQTENILITGSPIQMYTVTGSTGGTTPDLIPDYTFRAVTASNGQTYFTEYGTPVNPMLNLTQSWLGITPSISGSVPFTQSTAVEFFNGEFSGSNLIVEDGELNPLNPVKYPSTQILTYEISGSLDVINGVGSPSSGEIYWTADDGTTPGGSLTLQQYVSTLWINETSLNNIDIETALSNLQIGDTINFTVKYNLDSGGGPTVPIEKNIVTSIKSISGLSTSVWRIDLPFNSATSINPDQFIYTLLFNSGSYNVFFNPYINDINYAISDYNPIINNELTSRPNNKLFDIDFSSNAITAVNGQNIISASRGTGSATPASVPESNYTTLRSANPRYFGCENTSPAINIGSGSSLPVVEQLGRFALVYKGAGKSDNLVPNSTTFFNITTGVDEDGNLYQPQTSSAYQWNAENVFGKDDIINVVVQNSSSVSQTTLTTLQGNQTVNSLFEFPNSFLTTTSASGFNIFDYPPANTGSIYLIDETNQVGAFVSPPYWATSSATPFTITASTAGGPNLGFYLNEAISGTANWAQQSTPNRQGLNAPIDNIVPRIGDLFYLPNFELPFTVTDVSVGGGEFAVTFDKAITSPSDTAAELNKFVFVRNYQNLNRINLNINLSGSNPQVGSGVIFTQKETQKFIDNFSTITSNLISKNLL
jgi:hypothetical protein